MAEGCAALTRVLYILGLGRSGSTVLDRVLAQQPGLVSLGEAVNIWRNGVLQNRRCACGQPFRDCRFWADVSHAYPEALSVDAAEEVLRLHDRYLDTRQMWRILSGRHRDRLAATVPASYFHTLGQLYAGVAAVSGAATIVDSSKHPVYAFLLAQVPDVEMEFVHLVRDPRAVAYSWTRTKVEPGTRQSSNVHRYPPVKSAVLWNLHNTAAHRLLESLPSARRLVRYEDFAASPGAVVAGLLDISQEATVAAPRAGWIVDLAPGHALSGNPMRFVTGQLEVRPDDEWREGLKPWDRAVVRAITWPLWSRYGYPRPLAGSPTPRA